MEDSRGNSNERGIRKRSRSFSPNLIYKSGLSQESKTKKLNRKGMTEGSNGKRSDSQRSRKQLSSGMREKSLAEVSTELSSGACIPKESSSESVRKVNSGKLNVFSLELNGDLLSVPKHKRSLVQWSKHGGGESLNAGAPSSGEIASPDRFLKLEGEDLVSHIHYRKVFPEKEGGEGQLNSEQKANKEQGRADCLVNNVALGAPKWVNNVALGSQMDSLKIPKKKSLNKGKESEKRILNSAQNANEGVGKPRNLVNEDVSRVQSDSSKVHQKKGLYKGKKSGNKKWNSSQDANKEYGKCDRFVNGDGLGNHMRPQNIRKKKGLDKSKESGDRLLKSSLNANEDRKTGYLVSGNGSRTQIDPPKEHKQKGLYKVKENGGKKLKSSKSKNVENAKNDRVVLPNDDSTRKKSRLNHKKTKKMRLDKKGGAKKDGHTDDNKFITTCDELDEEDEENLEENAARMLSSCFDPSYTGFSSSGKSARSPSKNGLSLLSPDQQFARGPKSSPGSESASVYNTGMVLRPRSQDKKGLKRKRRHYYEMPVENLDPHWVLNRSIKVYWPLDQSWYCGLVDNYDEEKNVHHVKYVDRDEEWIDLKNEKFKLLLLPSEAPGKAERKRLATKEKSMDNEKGNFKSIEESENDYLSTEDDSHGSRDSEPIISWLARSNHLAKSSFLHHSKKQKTSDMSLNLLHLSSQEVGQAHRCREEALKSDMNNMSRSYVPWKRVDEVDKGKKFTSDNKTCSENNKVPIVYCRRRYRKTLPATFVSDNFSTSRVAFGPIISCDPINELTVLGESVVNAGRVDGTEPLWSINDARLLKLTLHMVEFGKYRFEVCLPKLLVSNYASTTENFRLFRDIMLFKYGTVTNLWPHIHLEMLFVDNTWGLRFLLFEGCLKQVVAFVFFVLSVFGQPSKGIKYINLQFPVTSIRFKFSGVNDCRKNFVFKLYNFSEVSFKKWMYLDYKLQKHCLCYGQLLLFECTFDNLKVLQNGCIGIPGGPVKSDISSVQGSLRRSRRGITLMGASRKCTNVDLGHVSSSSEMQKKLPPFALSFMAVPTFFHSLHFKLLLERRVPCIGYWDHGSIEHQEIMDSLMINDRSGMVVCRGKALDITPEINLEALSKDFTYGKPIFCSKSKLEATGILVESSQLLAVGDLGDVKNCVCSQGSKKSEHNANVLKEGGRCSDLKSNRCLLLNDVAHGGFVTSSQMEVKDTDSVVFYRASVEESSELFNSGDRGTDEIFASSLNPKKNGINATVLIEDRSCNNLDSTRLSIEGNKSDMGSHTPVYDVSIGIPTCNQLGVLVVGESNSLQHPIDVSHNRTGGLIYNTNPTALRSSTLQRNRSSSSSGYLSHGWSVHKDDLFQNDFNNRPKRPRTQVSYSVVYRGIDFDSRATSHLQKGFQSKQSRRSYKKRSLEACSVSKRDLDLLSCEANLLIMDGDKGWREYGAQVVLELCNKNEWKLAVKLCRVTKYLYKALQFLQPSSTNRYTHAMMWKGGKDWILEFPNRSQWAVFKEMHQECYSRNLRAALVKNIPIPGVRLIDEPDDKGADLLFVRNPSKYLQQVQTDLEMALDRSRVLYDMDTEDENWLKNQNYSTINSSNLGEISEKLFEKTMDIFEKLAFEQQHDQFMTVEIEDLAVETGPVEIIKTIYKHRWQKRQKKGMPLIRHLQPPLWQRYQQQLTEWEQAMSKSNHILPNGHKGKAFPTEKPPMFAFCLKPRDHEVPNKGSKQRSQKRISISAHNNLLREQDGYHAFRRKLNGVTPSKDTITYQRHYCEHVDDSSSNLTLPRAFSPRDVGSARHFSTVSDEFNRVHSYELNRSKSKKMGTTVSQRDPHMVVSYTQGMIGKRNGIHQRNLTFSEGPQHQYQSESSKRYSVNELDDPDLDELRWQEAARRATNIARLKREKAQRMLYKVDILVHKAVVALMTAEAIKGASDDSGRDGLNN